MELQTDYVEPRPNQVWVIRGGTDRFTISGVEVGYHEGALRDQYIEDKKSSKHMCPRTIAGGNQTLIFYYRNRADRYVRTLTDFLENFTPTNNALPYIVGKFTPTEPSHRIGEFIDKVYSIKRDVLEGADVEITIRHMGTVVTIKY